MKVKTLITPLFCVTIITACNSGGSSSNSPKYIPAGQYTNTAFTASCTGNGQLLSQSFNAITLAADSSGNISDPTTNPPQNLGILNYANSTCFSAQLPNTNDVSNLSITYNNCSYNTTTNVLNFTEVVVGTSNNIIITCTGQSTLTPLSSNINYENSDKSSQQINYLAQAIKKASTSK